jgi:hypothetical protein
MLNEKTKRCIVNDLLTDDILDDKAKIKELENKYGFILKEVTDYSLGLRRCFLLKEIK